MTCSEWNYKRNDNWQVPYEMFNGFNMDESNRKNYYTMDKDDGPYVEYGIKMAEQGR